MGVNAKILVRPNGYPNFIDENIDNVRSWLIANPSRTVEILVRNGGTWVNAYMNLVYVSTHALRTLCHL